MTHKTEIIIFLPNVTKMLSLQQILITLWQTTHCCITMISSHISFFHCVKKLQISDFAFFFLAQWREKRGRSTAVIQSHECSSELPEIHPEGGQNEGISSEGYFQVQQLRHQEIWNTKLGASSTELLSMAEIIQHNDINRKSIGFDFILDAAFPWNSLVCDNCFICLFLADAEGKAKWTSNINLSLPATYCQPKRLF